MDPRRGPPPPHHVYPQQPVPTNPMMMMARSQYGAGRSQQQQAYNGHQYPPTPLSYPHPQQSQTAQRGDGYYDPYIYYQDSQRGSHPGRHYQQPPPQQQQQHSQPYPMMVRLQHPPPPSASFVEPSRYGYPPPPQRQYSHSQMQPYPSQYYNSSGHPAPHYSSLNHPPPPFYAASAIAHVSDRRISSRDKHRGREGIVHPPHQGLIVNGEVYNESMESQTPITPTEGPLSTPVVIVIDDDDIATESITKSPEGKKKRQLQLEKDTLPSPVSASHEHAPNALPAPPVLQTEAKPVEKQACTNLPKNTGLPTKPLKESIRCKMCNIYFTGMGAAKVF